MGICVEIVGLAKTSERVKLLTDSKLIKLAASTHDEYGILLPQPTHAFKNLM